MQGVLKKYRRYHCKRCNTYFDLEALPQYCPICKHYSSDFIKKVNPIKRLWQNLTGYKLED